MTTKLNEGKAKLKPFRLTLMEGGRGGGLGSERHFDGVTSLAFRAGQIPKRIGKRKMNIERARERKGAEKRTEPEKT